MDFKLFYAINQFAGDFKLTDTVGRFAAEYVIFLIAALLVFLWFMDWGLPRMKNRYAVVLAVLTLMVSRLIITPIIRGVWPRMRPFVDHDVTLLIQQSPIEPGFPSGHAIMAFAMALPVFLYNRKAGAWLLFLAVLVGVGRVFAGVHYPSDVLAGFAFALVVTLILNYYRDFCVAPIVRFLSGRKP